MAPDAGARHTLAAGFGVLVAVWISLIAVPGAEGLFGSFLATLMLGIAVADSRDYIIPNPLAAAAAALAMLRAGTAGPDADLMSAVEAGLRAVAISAPLLALMFGYRRLRGRDGLGLGDVKLAAVTGLWLDWTTILAAIEVAALTALAAYFIVAYARRRPLRATAFLPFGAFLAPTIWFGWLFEAWLRQ
jgi:leader peptidase (prepilin peptidase)/N-methyltransferase